MSFLAPIWLFLLVLAALPWVLRAESGARHARMRSLIFVLLAIALARPVIDTNERRVHHAVIVDATASVDSGGAARRGTALLAALPDGDRTTAVLLGPEELDAEFRGTADKTLRITGPSTSSLAAALSAAERTIPDGARGSITLISDGLATDARHGPVVARLSAREIPVHVVPMSPKPGRNAVTGLVLDGTARVGHTARIHVDFVSQTGAPSATEVGTADVTLDGPTGPLAPPQRASDWGGARFEFEPVSPGYLSVTAKAGAPMTKTIAVQDALRVLHVGGRVSGSGERLAALIGAGFDVTFAPDGEQTDLPALDGYDLVVVDDRPADTVSDRWQRDVVRAVTERGLGLVMCGGGGAFGPGGWHDTPLAAVLPIESAQKEEKRDPSTTLAIIIDTSGSMSGGRVQLAKEVARLAMRRLLPHDKVGIVEFYGAKRWAAPLQPASNAIELQRALNRLNAGGGTVILPAIEEAYYGMQNVQTRYKHVLILTDGGVERGAFEPLLRKMAEEGMNVSTVLIGGSAHSEFLVSIANWGKGRFYAVPNRFNLPELLLKQPTTARLPAYRPGTHPVRARGGAGWWGNVDASAVPPLSGYVETRAKPAAITLLETQSAGHPVVASWRRGLGRVTVMTTEPTGPGTSGWTNWPDYGRFLARILERTARDADAEFAFSIVRDDDLITVVAERSAPGLAKPFATRLAHDGAMTQSLDFREIADGLFRARFAAEPEREVRVEASVTQRPGDAGSPPFRLVSSALADVSGEAHVPPGRAEGLALIARATGGEIVTAGDIASFRPRAGGGVAPRDVLELRPLLLLLALLAYLGDVLVRRLRAADEPGRGAAGEAA